MFLESAQANLLYQEEIVKKEHKGFNCEERCESFTRKGNRRNLIEQHHPKQFSCEHCDSKFEKSWMYAKHLEIHSLEKDKKCLWKSILLGMVFQAAHACS